MTPQVLKLQGPTTPLLFKPEPTIPQVLNQTDSSELTHYGEFELGTPTNPNMPMNAWYTVW